MSLLTPQGEALRQDLSTKGYALIEHGISPEQVDGLIQTYADFTDNLPEPPAEIMNRMLPLDTDPKVLDRQLDELDYSKDNSSQWHKYRTNHSYFAKPGGYTNRTFQTQALQKMRGLEIDDDPKEFYHFSPNGLAKIISQHERYRWGALPPEVHALHDRFAVIHIAARLAMIGSMRELEQTHPELLSKYATPADLDTSPLRLLFYHPGQGDILASGHYDKSIATIQIAESHLGLRVLNPSRTQESSPVDPLADERMQLLRRPVEMGVFFPGLNLTKAYPDSEITATWHDVTNTSELNDRRILRGRNVARWSLIFFANSERIGVLSKDETHHEDATVIVAEAA